MGRKDYERELNTVSLFFQETRVYERFQYGLRSLEISPSLIGFTGTDVSEALTSSKLSVADGGCTLFETLIPINQFIRYHLFITPVTIQHNNLMMVVNERNMQYISNILIN